MISTRFRAAAIACGLIAVTAGQAMAADLFTVTVTSNGVTDTAGFNSAQDAINQFKNGQLSALIPTYTSTSIASGAVDYRGLTVMASFPTTGTTLRFQVPAAGIDQTFTGTTRDSSQQLLVDYLKKSNAYGTIMHALAAASPVDPVAGNPSSLQSNLVSQGFGAAFSTTPNGANFGATGQRTSSSNLIGAGLSYGHFTGSTYSSDAYTIPLSYAFGVGKNDDYRVQIDLPLTYLNTQGAQSGAVSLGVGVTVPVTENWSLTPRVSAGATGSISLASAAALYALSVTSAYRFSHNDYDFVIGNMLGYSHSINVTLGSYSVDPHLSNVFTKNGAMVAIPFSKMGTDIGFLPGGDLQLFLTDTYFTGSKLYENNIIEAGFSVGSSRLQVIGHDVRIGLTYLHGTGDSGHSSNGLIGNLGFKF